MLTESDVGPLLRKAEHTLSLYVGVGIIKSIRNSDLHEGPPRLICEVNTVVNDNSYTITPVSQGYVVAGALNLQNEDLTGELDSPDETDSLYMIAQKLADANKIGIGKDMYSNKLRFLKTTSSEDLYDSILKIHETEEQSIACLVVATDFS
ncbi:MAG: hypothetical protein KAH93_04055 [Candidatus Aenigmarchaeota archaeon]|nr:hypothetical protein [Candidatus Aenigmarchaeota archaeon]